ncbi:MAG TPA: helix-turn-helix transcriptional regulator [Gemmatimonadaceae bacterium]|nr:helix-turn-helix transcriptional regulator [Gemmatimonadaceae bacterium]
MTVMSLRAVQRLCCAGLDSVSLRRAVAERLAPELGSDAWSFSTCDPDTGLMAHTVSEGLTPWLARQYVERLYPYEVARLSIDMPRNGANLFSALALARESREALLASGLFDQLNVSLVSRGRLWGTFCLMRGDRSPIAGAHTRTVLRRLVPHLARGLREAVTLDRALAPDVPTDATPGVLVLDAHNSPTLLTAAARRWLEDLADVGCRLDDGVPLAILALVSLLRADRSDVTGTRRTRARGQSGRWYAVSASLAEPDASGECATTVIVEPIVARPVAPALGWRYDLSAREREVVAAVVRGEPTKCIAAQLGISPYTVAEHLDRACAKVGVRGRKALVAKLFLDGRALPVSA